MIDVNQLETKGYTVVKNFFTPDFIQHLAEPMLKFKSNNKVTDFINAPDNIAYKLHCQLKPLLDIIHGQTHYGECILTDETTYIDNSGLSFEFHQEHEPYFIYQDLSKYLIFYLPLIKEFEDKSGLSVIPHDKVKEYFPRHTNIMLGTGAKSYFTDRRGKTTISLEATDEMVPLDDDISNYAEVPLISPGDVLLMQGSLIHATQDQLTNRIAMSIRYVNKDAVIDKDTLFNAGGSIKKSFLKRRAEKYQYLYNKFTGPTMTAQQHLKEYNIRIGNEKDYPN